MNQIATAINKALRCGSDFYAYRLPLDGEAHFHASVSPGFKSQSGFRIVPFDAEFAGFDEIAIYQEFTAPEFLNADIPSQPINAILPDATTKAQYGEAIDKCLHLLHTRELDKIVLSKVVVCDFKDMDWGTFFNILAEKYQDAFVFIYQTNATGAWIGATPETLGSYHNGIFTTMALAGTRAAGTPEEWGNKEIKEQEFVAEYISSILKQKGILYKMSHRFTKHAGQVEHLCNSFRMHTTKTDAEELVSLLHPTPAVSGIPKEKAIQQIRETEPHCRSCYGGYVGPFSPSGFDYFVNLRSMQFNADRQALFCGGGITAESDTTAEWEETEAKSETLKSILYKMAWLQ